MSRDIENIYKKVTHREHILLRPERHVGTVKPRTENTWLVNKETNQAQLCDVTYRPALIKLFDEIITNSVDFSKTPEGKHLDTINVDICKMSGCITVQDNGGIAVVKHKDYDGWLPDMLFGELFSSSNYNEHDEDLSNDTGAGQNGEGASLVNVFSTVFSVTTCDGKNKFERTWTDNSNIKQPETISKTSRRGTTISFIPDLARFPEGNLSHDLKMMERRVYEVAACNPHIKVKLDGREIKVQDFTSFCSMFGSSTVDDNDPKWSVGIFKSTNGFQHFSYVNSVQTRVGGPHVDYVVNKLVEHARPKLKRAYKTDYKPSFIKNVIGLVLVCEIKLPRFNGQTKEELTTTISEFGSKWEPSEKFLTQSSKRIVEWFKSFHEILEIQEEDKHLDQIQKDIQQLKFYQIPKYSRATSRDRSQCKLFLTEGDSAAKPLGAAANRKVHGIYPLRGKIINAMDATRAKFAASNEIKSIVSIMGGLNLRGGLNKKELRYSEIILAMDADTDGIHIRGLVALAFLTYWPEFIEQGRLKYLETPVVIAYHGNERKEFFSESDFENDPLKHKYSKIKYLKGLGSNSTVDFRKYLEDPKYVKTFEIDSETNTFMDLAFNGDKANERKDLFRDVIYNDNKA